MRLVAWNCNMALHRKLDALMALNPDIAVVSECAEPERLKKKLKDATVVADQIWIGTNPNKGLAVLAFNDYSVKLSKGYDPSLRFIAPVLVDGPTPFSLLAVWAQNANDGIRRKDQPGPLRLALERYADLLERENSVVAGDFNNNVIWDKPNWPMNHADAVRILQTHGLVSVYHQVMGELQGEETVPTLFWRDRTKDGPRYHLDYAFLPLAWTEMIKEFTVGSFEDWCGSGLSDHVPVIVDLDRP